MSTVIQMNQARVEDYEGLIQKKVARKIESYHDYQDCCQECRIRVWLSFDKFDPAKTNGMTFTSWVNLQIDAAINNFLRDTYYTERSRREVPYGLLSDMELLLKEGDEGMDGIDETLHSLGLSSDKGSQDQFRRWVDSSEREEVDVKELEAEILRNLKPLQVEIYQMLKKGYTQRQIAAGLDHGTISQPYVHKQIKKIQEVVIKILRRREYT